MDRIGLGGYLHLVEGYPDFVEYIELSGRPEFNDIFTEALTFPTQQHD